uniref:Uncharacterized protein n=1 Tax=Anguilla anguilla TaxID=7936 RepID=A0A0E9T753_ANGAN
MKHCCQNTKKQCKNTVTQCGTVLKCAITNSCMYLYTLCSRMFSCMGMGRHENNLQPSTTFWQCSNSHVITVTCFTETITLPSNAYITV